MIKSKFLRKIAGLPAEDVEHKPYPVPEEDSSPDDDSAEIKYMAKEKLAKTSKPGA
ncbi:MAG TPA: hypothetical protein VFD10_10510 [Atribacterota bacterium]|nr:hypothetical protein [Atribacterota bacterium]